MVILLTQHCECWQTCCEQLALTSIVDAQSSKLEPRSIEGKGGWDADKLFAAGRPVLWASATVWSALNEQELLMPGSQEHSVKVADRGIDCVSWVFVPTFNRYHAKPDKQMLLDWADVMQGHSYVRFVVIRPIPAEEQVAEPISPASVTTLLTLKTPFVSSADLAFNAEDLGTLRSSVLNHCSADAL